VFAATLGLAGCLDTSALTRHFGEDAGSPDGAAITCPGQALLCDGFENGTGQWLPDPQPTGQAGITVDGICPHTGAAALHGSVRAGGSPGQEHALLFRFTPRTQGSLAVRTYFKTPAPLGDYASLIWLTHDPNPDPYSGFAVTLTQSQGLVVEPFPQAGGSAHASSPTTGVANDRWTCLELVLQLGDSATGRVQLYVDDALVVDAIDATISGGTPSYGLLWVGVVRAQGDRDEDRFFDDVVLADARIGCGLR
jgi:hypothetical protein